MFNEVGNLEEAEKALLEKKVELDLREIKLDAQEAELKLREEVATTQIAAKEDKFRTTVSANDRVRSMKEQGMKREQQVAAKADNKLATGVTAMQQTVEKMAEMQTQLVAAMTGQMQEMKGHINAVVKAVTAPRKRKAIRGKDGRLESVEETVA